MKITTKPINPINVPIIFRYVSFSLRNNEEKRTEIIGYVYINIDEIEAGSVSSPRNQRVINKDMLRRLIINNLIYPTPFSALREEYENIIENIAANIILNNSTTKGGS